MSAVGNRASLALQLYIPEKKTVIYFIMFSIPQDMLIPLGLMMEENHDILYGKPTASSNNHLIRNILHAGLLVAFLTHR